MDYFRIYKELITNAKQRLSVEGYTETHHIKMRSHGGSDEHDNLVKLTAREHFIAHWLLWKIHRDPPSAHAWWSMVRNNKQNSRANKRYNISSRLYAAAKHAMCEALRGRELTIETKQKISDNSARKGKPNWNTGIKWKKVNYQKTLTDDRKKKIGDALRGRETKTTVCPHCGKEGKSNAMKRWHFDNCKENI